MSEDKREAFPSKSVERRVTARRAAEDREDLAAAQAARREPGAIPLEASVIGEQLGYPERPLHSRVARDGTPEHRTIVREG
jgi:hypothetical protein